MTRAWMVMFVWLLWPQLAWSQDCSNPRAAADSLFIWQTQEDFDPAKAAACLTVPADLATKREHLAVQFKKVLDARGLYVPVSSLPDEPDAVNADGESRFVPMPDAFPAMVIEQGDDGQWRYAESTVARVPDLYRQTFSPFSLAFQNALPSGFHRPLVAGFAAWQLGYGLLLLLLSWLAGGLVNLALRTYVRNLLQRSRLEFNADAYAKLTGPVTLLVTLLVVVRGIPDLQLTVRLSQTLLSLGTVIAGFSAIVALDRATHLAATYARDWADDQDNVMHLQAIPLLHQATRVIIWALGILFLLQNMGIDVVSLVAGLGIGGLALALAAKDTVANLFGSLQIFFDKPFKIGDWVIIGSVEGTVEEVGFRSTRVRTFDNALVTVPNQSLTTANVTNMSARPRRRVKFILGLTYDTPPDALQAFVQGVRGILAANPAVAAGAQVHFHQFAGSSLDVLVYYHLEVPTWTDELENKAANHYQILCLADDLGISFAFPSTSVYLESTPSEPLRSADTAHDVLQARLDAYAPGGAKVRTTTPQFTQGWSGAQQDRGAADDA